jgi:hypothetical protein
MTFFALFSASIFASPSHGIQDNWNEQEDQPHGFTQSIGPYHGITPQETYSIIIMLGLTFVRPRKPETGHGFEDAGMPFVWPCIGLSSEKQSRHQRVINAGNMDESSRAASRLEG